MTNSEFIGKWMEEANNIVSGKLRPHFDSRIDGVHRKYGNLSFTWFSKPRIAVHPLEQYEQWGELESYNARLALLVRDRHSGNFELLLNSEIWGPTTRDHMWETKWALDATTELKSIGLYEIPLGIEHANGVTSRFDSTVSKFVLDGALYKIDCLRAFKKGTRYETIRSQMHHINKMGKQMIGTIIRPDMGPYAEKAVDDWEYLMDIADQVLYSTPKSKVKNVIRAHMALI